MIVVVRYILDLKNRQDNSIKEWVVMNLTNKNSNINRLREYRTQRGISQTYIGKQLGYKSTSGYANIESGKVDLTVETALKICKILNVDFEELFFE